jgi:DNA-directed RNA polymerase subunit RPC12/RpoP
MQIDLSVFEATIAIPTCPDCGSRHYEVDNRMVAGALKCESVTCATCGFDILAAWHDLPARKAQA